MNSDEAHTEVREVWRACLSAPPRLGGRETHVLELSRAQAHNAPVRLLFAWGDPVAEPHLRPERVKTLSPRFPAAFHASLFACRVVLRLERFRRHNNKPRYLHVHGDVYEAAVLG